jgi:hypothetical protein
MEVQPTKDNHATPGLSRRKARARLGIAAGVAYAAPTIGPQRQCESPADPVPAPGWRRQKERQV